MEVKREVVAVFHCEADFLQSLDYFYCCVAERVLVDCEKQRIFATTLPIRSVWCSQCMLPEKNVSPVLYLHWKFQLKFLVDTMLEGSVIPCYAEKRCLQATKASLLAANNTQIHIYGQKFLNRDLGICRVLEPEYRVRRHINTNGPPVFARARRWNSDKLRGTKREFQHMVPKQNGE
ncbi:unnamed protein product [Rodentolepis nana]|uniref:60S ribosomal export protein NMD3 n=1 Tax=Rodentolepis nana TaxID=102285 RepID=A0A0R3TJU9_RODNA|nr:unnamed protein product [Rodentolepis nana]